MLLTGNTLCQDHFAMSTEEFVIKVPEPCKPLVGRVRDRIFRTACDLFYRHGIRAVGVDAIACEAGTNKMSFYRSFASKDELVAEYLREQVKDYWTWWDAAIAPQAGDPRKQLEALFGAFVGKMREGTTCGCPLGNAAVEIRDEEHPGFIVIREYKAEIRRRLRKLARATGASKPDHLGDALMLLMEGSYSTRLTFNGPNAPFAAAATYARQLIDLQIG